MSYYDRDRRPRQADGTPDNWSTQTAAGTMNHPTTHYGNTAEFLVSGWPYIHEGSGSGSVTFTHVTQWFVVTAGTSDVEISFKSGGKAFVVPAGTTSPRLDLKCVTVYHNNDCTIIAGLTNVLAAEFPDMSEWTGIK